jgi:predicted SAM-dependent methyltransferase
MTTGDSFDFEQYPYLNIGGGNFNQRESGWLNLDFPFDAMAKKHDASCIDIAHNLMADDPLPIPDNALKCVYSEHSLEHLPHARAERLAREVLRVLKPWGGFRIAVPDADHFWSIVTRTDGTAEEFPSVWRTKGSTNTREQVFLDATLSPLRERMSDAEVREIADTMGMEAAMAFLEQRLEAVDLEGQAKKPGAHRSWWNCARLGALLLGAGFVDFAGPLARNESCHKAFRKPFLDRTAYKCTVRVEARKP